MKLARMPDGSPEIFHSIQGEGRHTGMPAIFIRASLCNLHCRWCDTDYTWNWDDTDFETESGEKFSREEQILTMPVREIADWLERKEFSCSNFVFTGGEPLLQEREWVRLMKAIEEFSAIGSAHFEVETNGTLVPGDEFLAAIHQLNISPKLANSGMDEEKRILPDVLRALAAISKADFKFVVQSKGDFEEVAALVTRFEIDPGRVFLMPMARSAEELDRNAGPVADYCRENGFRFSDRLHLRLFGAGRGV